MGKNTDNKILTLYHGSSEVVSNPQYGKGKPDNDYGSGFYTTEIKERANEWAYTTGSPDRAVRNEYIFDTSGLNILRLDDSGTLAWIAEVAFNRGVESEIDPEFVEKFIECYKVDTSDADAIIGYRADDSYTKVITSFFNNELTVEEVDRIFRKGELGEQVFIKSERAFDTLTFTGYEDLDLALQDKAGESERIARREVAEILDTRSKAIRFEHYNPESKGLTMLSVVAQKYVFLDGYYMLEPGGGLGI